MQNDPFLVEGKICRFCEILKELSINGYIDKCDILNKSIFYYKYRFINTQPTFVATTASLFQPQKVVIVEGVNKCYHISVNGMHVYSLTEMEFNIAYDATLEQFKKDNPHVVFN